MNINIRVRTLKTAIFMLTLILAILACGTAPSSTAVPATDVSSVSPSAEPGIQHQTIPVNLPSERSSHAGDNDSSANASKKIVTGGDRFTYGKFERPFSANTMDQYFPGLDIIDTFVYEDDTWIYGKIVLEKLDSSNNPDSKYALEIDLDLDGKGDWLIVAKNPTSTDWSVNGVQAFEDKNKDVGGATAMFTDKNTTNGDGYETLVFDQGNGDDVDTAWARLSPTDPNTIEIAVKRSVLGDTRKFLIDTWAGTSILDPKLFDLNDHFTHEQAGAADPGFEIFYPIKQVAEVDNSCKMAVGFEPTGSEPGLCETLIPHVPGATPVGCQLTTATCTQRGMSFDSANCQCIPIP